MDFDHPHFIQQVKMMSLLWRYLLKHKINFCPDCTRICPTSLQFILLHAAVIVFGSHVRTCMPLLKAVEYAQTNNALITVIQSDLCFSSRTRMTAPLCAFGRSVLQMFGFQSAKLGCRWSSPASRHATGYHIGFM